ncbi:MAG: 50S ribosomal protein L16 [Candidatus Helarchaeota archaeon]
MPKRPWKGFRNVQGKAWVLRWKKTGKGRRYYIKHAPEPKIRMFTIGKDRPDYDYEVELFAEEAAQVNHLTLESCRISCNRLLRAKLGRDNYLFRIYPYPHHVVREHRMMAFAGADRLQDGMRHAFGKPFGRAARVRKGQKLMSVKCYKDALLVAKDAIRRGSMKWPMPCRIIPKKINE